MDTCDSGQGILSGHGGCPTLEPGKPEVLQSSKMRKQPSANQGQEVVG